MYGYRRIVALLACSSFAMGVAEFIISGLLTEISKYFAIFDDDAGNLATLYAIGVVVGTPIISVLISSWTYKTQLFFALGVFSVANFIVFFGDNFTIALIARFISGLMHGLFFVIATIITMKVVPEDKTSYYLSIMVSGLTIALVTGVPLGIFLAEKYGLLSPFAFVGTFSLIISITSLIIMPKIEGQRGSFKNLALAFKFPPIYQGFIITAFTCGSQFVLYVYLRVFLEKHGFNSDEIKNIFVLYGISAIIGNLIGGKLANSKGAFNALNMILISQLLFFALMSASYMLGKQAIIINIIFVAFFGFASISPLKILSIYLSKKYTPQTQNTTIALNEASFNIGIALASFIGGMVEYHIKIDFNGIFAGLFSLIALYILITFIKKIYKGDGKNASLY